MRLDRKAFGRIATTFVATAMLAAFAAVPAMAEGSAVQTGDTFGTPITDIEINKVVKKPKNAIMPNVTFSFTVDKAEKDEAEGALLEDSATGTGTGGSTVTLDVYNGMVGGVYLDADAKDGQVTFSGTGNYGVGSAILTGSFKLSIDPSKFTHAGVYKYVVKEEALATPIEGLDIDSNARYLYVYVENPENGETGMQVVGAVVKDATGKTDNFTNTYLNNGTTDKVNELYISKTVTGQLGSKSEEFAFTIIISSNVGVTGAEGTAEQYYAVVEKWDTKGSADTSDDEWVTDTQAAGTTAGVITLNSGLTPNNFKLKDNQRLHIYGLSDHDQYTIVETAAGQNGYTTSVDAGIGNDPSTDNKTVTGDVDPTGSIQNIVYTNRRDSVTPTGVLLNVAPYALMVIIAAAGCFVFLRKRRDD